MTLILIFVAMTVAVLAALLIPLLRGGGKAMAVRAEYDLRVYRDQLTEVDKDVARGLMTKTEAEAARLEIQRRMLAADAETQAPETEGLRLPRTGLAVFVSVAVALGAGGLYLLLGAPGIPDQPYAERKLASSGLSSDQTHQVEQMVQQLAEKMRANPGDQNGYLMLGRSYSVLGRYGDAYDAYKKAAALGPMDADAWSEFGEAAVSISSGLVTPEAQQAFQSALAENAFHPGALYYLGLARLQASDAKGAIAIWKELERVSPAEAPWLTMLRESIRQAGEEGGIDPAQVAPKPPVSQGNAPAQAQQIARLDASQSQMAAEMVKRLEDRLKENPNDAEGWAKLARSYNVMGRKADAAEAFRQAQEADPKNVRLKLAYAGALLQAAGLTDADPHPPEVTAVLRKVLELDSNNRDALFFVGLAASREGNSTEARRLWTRLLSIVEKDAPGRAQVEKLLESLPKK